MNKIAESVSTGHPDKIADYISCYILDHYLKINSNISYKVDVVLDNHKVLLHGNIQGENLPKVSCGLVHAALCDLGYFDDDYQKECRDSNHECISRRYLSVENYIRVSRVPVVTPQDITFTDSGVYTGYCTSYNQYGLSIEHGCAKAISDGLFNYCRDTGAPYLYGLDNKVQVTINENREISSCVVKLPLLKKEGTDLVTQLIDNIINTNEAFITCDIQKSKNYELKLTDKKHHSSVNSVGMTGRKLAIDFYSSNHPIGGGCLWGKDYMQPDVCLNILAKIVAKETLNIAINDGQDVYKSTVDISNERDSDVFAQTVTLHCNNGNSSSKEVTLRLGIDTIREFKLNKPIYSQLCLDGLSGYKFNTTET